MPGQPVAGASPADMPNCVRTKKLRRFRRCAENNNPDALADAQGWSRAVGGLNGREADDRLQRAHVVELAWLQQYRSALGEPRRQRLYRARPAICFIGIVLDDNRLSGSDLGRDLLLYFRANNQFLIRR